MQRSSSPKARNCHWTDFRKLLISNLFHRSVPTSLPYLRCFWGTNKLGCITISIQIFADSQLQGLLIRKVSNLALYPDLAKSHLLNGNANGGHTAVKDVGMAPQVTRPRLFCHLYDAFLSKGNYPFPGHIFFKGETTSVHHKESTINLPWLLRWFWPRD